MKSILASHDWWCYIESEMSSLSCKLSQAIFPRISHRQDELCSPPTHPHSHPPPPSIQKLAVDKFIKIIIISTLPPLKGCILNSFHYCLRTCTFSPSWGPGGVTLWGVHSHSPPASDQHFSRLWWQKPAKPAAHMENRHLTWGSGF